MDKETPSDKAQLVSANKIDTYKINNQNSVYYLQPGSKELYLLDLKKRAFSLETLHWPSDTPPQL